VTELAAPYWLPYYGVEIDPGSESFVVLLNPEGTSWVRSWCPAGDCIQVTRDQSSASKQPFQGP
jgi:hypothetical protein